MRHHTKDKGDQGLGFVMSDLLSKNIQIALPISEHLPFDCIAISEEGELCRLSVKFRAKNKKGAMEVQYRSVWADKNGSHMKKHKKTEYDASAIFCPDTNKCYYVKNDETEGMITLRIDAPKKGQIKNVKFASDYEDPMRLFN